MAKLLFHIVAGPRIELGTSWLWIMRSNQLSYRANLKCGMEKISICKWKESVTASVQYYTKESYQKDSHKSLYNRFIFRSATQDWTGDLMIMNHAL